MRCRSKPGRRNVADIDRISLAARKEEIVARKAKANHSFAGGDKKSVEAKSLWANLPKAIIPVHTRAESAKAADVGERTYDAGKLILKAVADSVPVDLPEQTKGRPTRQFR